MKIDSIKILGFILLVLILFALLMFFGYVSIGEKISRESYENEGVVDFDAWFWNIGIFLAIMAGFSYFMDVSCDLLFKKKEVYNERSRRRN